jgi:hypothetical protein
MDPWHIEPIMLDQGNCRVYVISSQEAHDTVGRENAEFNQIAGQFSKLCAIDIRLVKEVHRIEYSENSLVLKNYNFKREEFRAAGKGTKEILVFHGTSEENFEKIATCGFKIGGQDVAVRHGSALGPGVYTAIGT